MSDSTRRLILAACCVGMVTLSFATAALAVCLSTLGSDPSLGLSLTGRGGLLSAVSWGLAMAILAAGPLADRWGFRALLAAGAGCSSAGLALIAAARSPAAAVAGCLVLGVGLGLADALLTPVVCALYPDRRTRMSNLLHAFYPIGLIATVGLALALLEQGLSWRGVFAVLAVLPVPYGLAMLLLPLPRQSHAGPQRLPTRRLLANGGLWTLIGAIFLAGMIELGAGGWLPNFVEAATPAGRTAGGLALVLFATAMMIGRLGSSLAVHRIGVRGLFLAGGALTVFGLLTAARAHATTETVFGLTVVGLGIASFWPTVLGVAGDRFPQAGASMFAALSAAGCLGGVLGPMAVGLIGDAAGLRAGFAALAVAPVLVALLMARGTRKE